MKMAAKQNKGFSLIELLVAITILAIIAVPIMHGFVTGARTNAKARRVEQATEVAQNVMEDIKAKSLEELLAGDNVRSDPTSVIIYETGEEATFMTYTIFYDDVVADGVEYRAEAVLYPGVGVEDGHYNVTDYNQHELVQLYDMNAVYDAFFILEKNVDTAMVSQLAQTVNASEATVKAGVKRNVYLDIKKEAATEYVEVNVAYTYGGVTCYMATQNQCIYSNSDTETYLRNVYVFFSPLGNMQEGDVPKETVTIRNANCEGEQKPVQVYLVKQSGTSAEHYAVNVNVMEKSRDLASYQDAEGNLLVKTRICTNLSFPRTAGDATADEIAVRYSTWDGSYNESTSILGATYAADDLVGLTDLSAQDTQDWIYTVQVNVYEKDADASTTPLVSLTGTKEK